MSDLLVRDAWIERVLGVVMSPHGGATGAPDDASITDASDDEPDAETDKEQASIRVAKIREVHRQIEEALKEIKLLAEGNSKNSKSGHEGATQKRYAVNAYKTAPAELENLKRTDLDAFQAKADFRRLRDEYDKSIRLLASINGTLTKGVAVPELDRPGNFTPLVVNNTVQFEGKDLADNMQKQLDIFAIQVTAFTRIAEGGQTPTQRLFVRLTDEAAEASVLKPEDRPKMQAQILLVTRQACDDATAAKEAYDKVKNQAYVSAKLLGVADKESKNPSFLLLRSVIDGLKDDCGTAQSIKNLGEKWQARLVECEKIGSRIRDEIATPPVSTETISPADIVEELKKRGDPKDMFVKAGKTEKEADVLVKRLQELEEKLKTEPVPPDALQEAFELSFHASPDAIDADVKKAQENIKDPKCQAACKAALSAKFNIKLDIPEGMTVDRLPALYELMSRVPPDHFKGKLEKIAYETRSGASSYGSGRITLVGFAPEDTYGVYNEGQGEKEERFNRFNATTLHEIGHAVDDKGTVTKTNAKSAGYGEWQTLTLDKVVDELYTKQFSVLAFVEPKPAEQDLRIMIRLLLQTGRCDPPASAIAPLGSLFANWDLIATSSAYKVCTEIRDPGSKPWERPRDIGNGRACHESYAGRWVTYSFSERSAKAVRPYQWRAPGEWFADFYAYYYAEKDAKKRVARASFLPEAVRATIAG